MIFGILLNSAVSWALSPKASTLSPEPYSLIEGRLRALQMARSRALHMSLCLSPDTLRAQLRDVRFRV